MTLGELIETLSKEDPELVLPRGFARPHSYRGYYEQLAFEPDEHVAVGDMLKSAREALGAVYDGYKGGHYTMTEDTQCWLAEYGCTGEELSAPTLRAMLDAPQMARLTAENERLRAAIVWVTRDAQHKAPEQIELGLVGVWMERLEAAL